MTRGREARAGGELEAQGWMLLLRTCARGESVVTVREQGARVGIFRAVWFLSSTSNSLSLTPESMIIFFESPSLLS